MTSRSMRPTAPTLVTGDGSYNNMLPNLDFDVGLTDSLKARFSYSKTIARAGYGTLTAGQNAGTPGGSTINGFLPNANQNNPALLPLESDNFDISLEYYFSDTGYVSLGAFQKNVANFIGNSVQQINLFGIRNQTGGPSAQAALAFLQSAQCSARTAATLRTDDSALFTATAMLLNPGTFTDANGTCTGGLANYNGTNAQHVAFATKYDILPTANDPLYTFNVSTPVNNKEAKIHGFEFGGQYFFGETWIWRPRQLHDGRRRRRLRRDQRPEREPVCLDGSVRLGERGAHVREVRPVGSSRLQLARSVPADGQPGWLEKSDLRGSL